MFEGPFVQVDAACPWLHRAARVRECTIPIVKTRSSGLMAGLRITQFCSSYPPPGSAPHCAVAPYHTVAQMVTAHTPQLLSLSLLRLSTTGTHLTITRVDATVCRCCRHQFPHEAPCSAAAVWRSARRCAGRAAGHRPCWHWRLLLPATHLRDPTR